MGIQENILTLKKIIPPDVKLVAVSKTKPIEDILEAYEAGHRVFGENKAQELKAKHEQLPNDIEWHFIGHLQTNKVKYIAPFVSLFHGADSLKILNEFNKQAKKHERTVPCLLQFHIAEEDTKFGLIIDEAREILKSESFALLENIRIDGVMGMATYTSDKQQIKREFQNLKAIFETIKREFYADKNYFREISMGMSGDYLLAIECGSTMIRVGTIIFGSR